MFQQVLVLIFEYSIVHSQPQRLVPIYWNLHLQFECPQVWTWFQSPTAFGIPLVHSPYPELSAVEHAFHFGVDGERVFACIVG